MRRAGLGVVLALAIAAGCASSPPSEEVNRLRASAQRATIRLKEGGATLAEIAHEALVARRENPGGGAGAGEDTLARVAAAQLAVEALDEAERTYELGLGFQDYRAQLGGGPHPADATAARMAEAAAALEARAVFTLANIKAADAKTATRLRDEVEKDRQILKALRTALGVATRIADPVAEPAR